MDEHERKKDQPPRFEAFRFVEPNTGYVLALEHLSDGRTILMSKILDPDKEDENGWMLEFAPDGRLVGTTGKMMERLQRYT